MGVRAKDRNTVTAAGKHVGGRRAARNVARARHGHAAVGALSAAQTKLRHGAPLRRLHHARGLGRHERLEVNGVEERCLDELALERGAHNADHGLTRKDELALRNRVDIKMSAEGAQVFEEGRLEEGAARGRLERGKVVDVLLGKAQVLDQIGQIRGAAHDGEDATKGVVAVKRREAVLLGELAALPQALGHGELVQIGQKRDVGGVSGVRECHGCFLSSREAQMR